MLIHAGPAKLETEEAWISWHMKIYFSAEVEVIGYPVLLHLGPEYASETEKYGETMQRAEESEASILLEWDVTGSTVG